MSIQNKVTSVEFMTDPASGRPLIFEIVVKCQGDTREIPELVNLYLAQIYFLPCRHTGRGREAVVKL